MAGVKKIKREDIIHAALAIVRKQDINAVQARALAKKLNCSTQPILYQFKTMKEVKEAVMEEAHNIYQEYMLTIEDENHAYKEMGRSYLRFAKEEPNLFRLLFMNDENQSVEGFILNDDSTTNILKNLMMQSGLSLENAKQFHKTMWIFTHGIATLIVSKTCDFSLSQIDSLLTDEYFALLLLQSEQGNIAKDNYEKMLKEYLTMKKKEK